MYRVSFILQFLVGEFLRGQGLEFGDQNHAVGLHGVGVGAGLGLFVADAFERHRRIDGRDEFVGPFLGILVQRAEFGTDERRDGFQFRVGGIK